MFRKVPDIYIPVLWMENKSLLKGDFLAGIKLLLSFLSFGPLIWYGTGGIGFVIILSVVTYHLYSHNSLKKIKKNLAKNQNNEKESLKKSEEQKETDKEIVKYIIPEDKAVIID